MEVLVYSVVTGRPSTPVAPIPFHWQFRYGCRSRNHFPSPVSSDAPHMEVFYPSPWTVPAWHWGYSSSRYLLLHSSASLYDPHTRTLSVTGERPLYGL